MITQRLISYKIDTDLLDQLDREASLGFGKRNALINRAVRDYLILADGRRRIRACLSIDDQLRELDRLIKQLLPGYLYRAAVDKYILLGGRGIEATDDAVIEACNTDCPCYAQGTCPYPYKHKMECHRYRSIYNGEDE